MLGIAAVSPASSPLKDERLDLLSPEDDKKEIVTRRSRVCARSSVLIGEEDGRRISGNQEDKSYASFLSFESSTENERDIPSSRDTKDNEGLPLESGRTDAKEDTHISFSSGQADSSSIMSSTSSNSSDSLVLNSANQLTEGIREPDAANSSAKKWERQGARPKCMQTQRPVALPLRLSSSPLPDGLEKGFLARHSQDKAFQVNLYRDDSGLPSLGPERLLDTSFVVSLPNAPYFGAMTAFSYERLGDAFTTGVAEGATALIEHRQREREEQEELTRGLQRREQMIREEREREQRKEREREQREEFMRGLQRREQMIREERERERREKEDREWQEASSGLD